MSIDHELSEFTDSKDYTIEEVLFALLDHLNLTAIRTEYESGQFDSYRIEGPGAE